jgi:SOS-response transcriptional repressor LexA
MSKTDLLVKKNLEFLISRARTSPYALEREAGVPQPTIHRILTGESSDPRTKTLQPLAQYFGVTVADLRDKDLAADAGRQSTFDVNVRPASPGARPVPVISAIQAGLMKEMQSPYEVGDGYAVEYTDDRLSKWAFALDIEGLSMMPEFRPGDRVIIDPDLSPNPGDFVVAKNGGDEATFKKYRPRGISPSGEEIFELVPLNDDFAIMRSDTTPLEVIGVMTEHRKRYRRHK